MAHTNPKVMMTSKKRTSQWQTRGLGKGDFSIFGPFLFGVN